MTGRSSRSSSRSGSGSASRSRSRSRSRSASNRRLRRDRDRGHRSRNVDRTSGDRDHRSRSRDRSHRNAEHGGSYIIHLRGLPYSANERDVKRFFRGCGEGITNIYFTENNGKPDGDCWVEFNNSSDHRSAMKRDREYMGQRYIEVLSASRGAFERTVLNKIAGSSPNRTTNNIGRSAANSIRGPSNAAAGFGSSWVVRLRGTPYGVRKEQIISFFRGLEIISPGGIVVVADSRGKDVGEAFVRFASESARDKAMLHDREKIGHRYIELFKSDEREITNMLRRYGTDSGGGDGLAAGNPGYAPITGPIRSTVERRPEPRWRPSRVYERDPSPPKRHSGGSGIGSKYGSLVGPPMLTGGNATSKPAGGHFVFVKGMPYTATEKEVKQFFLPLIVKTVHVGFDSFSRSNGEANVEFYSHDDALQAMRKNKEYMGSRYLELQLNSDATPPIPGIGSPTASYSAFPVRR